MNKFVYNRKYNKRNDSKDSRLGNYRRKVSIDIYSPD